MAAVDCLSDGFCVGVVSKDWVYGLKEGHLACVLVKGLRASERTLRG